MGMNGSYGPDLQSPHDILNIGQRLLRALLTARNMTLWATTIWSASLSQNMRQPPHGKISSLSAGRH